MQLILVSSDHITCFQSSTVQSLWLRAKSNLRLTKGGNQPTIGLQLTNPTILSTSARSITIPVELYLTENGRITETLVLVDSGVTSCWINIDFIWRMKWLLEKLQWPMYTRNADGTNNSEGMICHQIKLHLRIDGRDTMQHFFVLNLRKKNNIILGYPWLTRNNPWIDWTSGEVYLIGTPTPRHDEPEIVEQQYLLCYLGAVERDGLEYATSIFAQQRNAATLQRVLGEDHPHIWKLMLSAALAQVAEKVKHKPPPQYAKYTKVFDDPKDGKLPPWWPFDHGIMLKDTFVPRVAKMYPMNPKETEVCKEFIDENLKAGKIRKSQSPQASPFFFIQKKDGGLHPWQDYWYLNEHMVKNAYLLPLISTLINKLTGARYFSKMDVWWGYNNIHIKEGDKWKAMFITPYGLYEPMVMFFGQCNSPPTFQAFMDSTFRDMIVEGWLIIYMDNILVAATTLEECQEQTIRCLKGWRKKTSI